MSLSKVMDVSLNFTSLLLKRLRKGLRKKSTDFFFQANCMVWFFQWMCIRLISSHSSFHEYAHCTFEQLVFEQLAFEQLIFEQLAFKQSAFEQSETITWWIGFLKDTPNTKFLTTPQNCNFCIFCFELGVTKLFNPNMLILYRK